MLFLLCQAGGHRLGIDVHNVIAVLPRARFQTAAGAQPWLAGLFAHNGRPTPVIDLAVLVSGQPSPTLWSSRIVLVSLDTPAGPHRLGVLVERVETAQLAEPLQESAAPAAGLPAWGPVLLHEGELVQFLELPRLLPPEQSRSLFAAAGAMEGP
jgi:chemotaxis signal transduction protein